MDSRRESLYHGAGLANTLELFSLPEESKAAVGPGRELGSIPGELCFLSRISPQG